MNGAQYVFVFNSSISNIPKFVKCPNDNAFPDQFVFFVNKKLKVFPLLVQVLRTMGI